VQEVTTIIEEPSLDRLYNAHRLLISDRAAGLVALEALAREGSTMSMLHIAEAYRPLANVPGSGDVAEVEKWYARAAEAGSAPGCYLFAHFLARRNRYVEACVVLEKPAAADFAPAIFFLGQLYFVGMGVKKNPEHAAQLMERAMNMGNIPAKFMLARYLIHVRPDMNTLWRGIGLMAGATVNRVKIVLSEGSHSEKLRYESSGRHVKLVEKGTLRTVDWP
jgi:TPR repeat protein